MYLPKIFEERNFDALHQFVEKNGFGTLVALQDGKPIASHLPFLIEHFEKDKMVFTSHVAKYNDLTKCFGQDHSLLMFLGAHGYISPQWYTEMNVPTWNYLSAHFYGTLQAVDLEESKEHLALLMKKYESKMETPKTMQDIPKKTLDMDLKGFTGLRFVVQKMEVAFKLSQNRDNASYEKIVYELQNHQAYSNPDLADAMKKKRP